MTSVRQFIHASEARLRTALLTFWLPLTAAAIAPSIVVFASELATVQRMVAVLAVAFVLGLSVILVMVAIERLRGVSDRAASSTDDALKPYRSAVLRVCVASGLSSILMLTGSLYVWQAYDWVLPSLSITNLLALSILATLAFLLQAALDLLRLRLLRKTADSLGEFLGSQAYDAAWRLTLKSGRRRLEPLRDLDIVRDFVQSPGIIASFDAPWVPIYLAAGFVIHPWIGLTIFGGGVILVVFVFVTEELSQRPIRSSTSSATIRDRLYVAATHNAEVLIAMGMGSRLTARWRTANHQYLESQRSLSGVSNSIWVVSRSLRLILQSIVFGIGIFLLIHQEITVGAAIAGSILAGRLLSPVDAAIANWKLFSASRLSWQRLRATLAQVPSSITRMVPLPPPTSALSLQKVAVVPPGSGVTVLQDVSFSLKAGDG